LLAAKITAPVPAVVDKLPTVVSASFKVRVPDPEVLDRFAIFPEKTPVGKLKLVAFPKAIVPELASICPLPEMVPFIVKVFEPISKVSPVARLRFSTVQFVVNVVVVAFIVNDQEGGV
jgi:hypothetical protein